MTKQILNWYVTAEKELALVEQELKKYGIVTDTVIGSMPEHPYVERPVTIKGLAVNDRLIRLLSEKRSKLKALRADVEQFLATVDDPLMGTAIRLRYVKGKSWQEVANELEGANTEGSIKMAVHRFLKKTETCYTCNE